MTLYIMCRYTKQSNTRHVWENMIPILCILYIYISIYIICMNQHDISESIRRFSAWYIAPCMRYNWTVMMQIHIHIVVAIPSYHHGCFNFYHLFGSSFHIATDFRALLANFLPWFLVIALVRKIPNNQRHLWSEASLLGDKCWQHLTTYFINDQQW